MQRRTAGMILVLAGLVLVVEPFAEKMFSRTGTFEKLSADFRPVMQPEAIAAFESDLQSLSTLPAAVQTSLLPAIAQAANLTPAQLQQLLATNYPAITAGLQAAGPVSTQLGAQIVALRAQQADFQKVDAIPTKTQSTEGIPWALVLAGVIAIIAGAAIFVPGGRFVPVTAVVLGALLIGVPLLTSMPSKSVASSRLNGANRTVLTRQNADSLRQAATTFTTMADEFQTKLLPDLSTQFNIPPAVLQSNPVVASIATTLPAGLARMQSFAGLIDRNVARYEAVRQVSFIRVTWIIIGSGIAVLFAGLIGLAYAQEVGAVREHRIRRALGRKEKEAAA